MLDCFVRTVFAGGCGPWQKFADDRRITNEFELREYLVLCLQPNPVLQKVGRFFENINAMRWQYYIGEEPPTL